MNTTAKLFSGCFRLVIVAGFMLCAHATLAGKATYILVNDWSSSSNPNGVWSYNHNATPISVFQPMWWGQAAWGYSSLGEGCIIKGSYFEGITDPWGTVVGPAHDWQPGDVMMHAISKPYGGDTTFLNVRWTCPADGIIDISGRAWDGEIFQDRDMSWALLVRGQFVAQRSSLRGIYRNDAAAQFSSNVLYRNALKKLKVKQGDVVEFRVAAETYYGHFAGVDLTINLNSRFLSVRSSSWGNRVSGPVR